MIVLTLCSSLQADGTVFGNPGQPHQRTSVGLGFWLLMPSVVTCRLTASAPADYDF